ncbi:gamma-glutamylcyclotransferase [Mangrovimicrobium sediminis]|uniref:Putative gamma-glutamylcyclotransferase n=1 Tax=Mangrovimicrobium sediminis TaxID=2562682 RepID=A0A4Z0MA01_9GAMM|nr:gamma-glutamylcyclotransferase family protein [Haliea sp. SAOS-164]TGD76208.1 gamma-glutamylcyclotransferase [Haliea sp. SAOS-164]
MQDIFVYGTLLNDEVLSILFDQPLSKVGARLPGYRRVTVSGQMFPAIRPDGNSSVEGALLTGLDQCAIALLDEYEGRFYQRESVLVYLECGTARHCQAYVFRPSYYDFLSDEAWCNERFREHHMGQYLARLPS